jgi:hypothetical protein
VAGQIVFADPGARPGRTDHDAFPARKDLRVLAVALDPGLGYRSDVT